MQNTYIMRFLRKGPKCHMYLWFRNIFPEGNLYSILRNYLHSFLARVFHCGVLSVLRKIQIFECFGLGGIQSVGDIVTHEEI